MSKIIKKLLILLIIFVIPAAAAGQGISPYAKNPLYWQYKGKPILLIGGSDLDNLFQWDKSVQTWLGESLTTHLDILVRVGGNYVRNTMSSRSYTSIGQLLWNKLPYPFKKVGNLYDLNKWNSVYWQKLKTLLTETQVRGIIVQLEIWDRWNESGNSNSANNGWYYSPWNPTNNINYNWSDSNLLSQGYTGFYNLFHTALTAQDPVLLPYQQKFVKKIIDTVIDGGFSNVLFQVDNESGIGENDLEPDPAWAQYIRNYAASKGKTVYVGTSRRFQWPFYYQTTNFQDWNNPEISNVILSSVFNFNDISQNNGNVGQIQYDNLIWYRNKMIQNGKQRPINHVKSYYFKWPTGSDFGKRTNGTDTEAGAKLWRAVFGGAASFRFHRNTPYATIQPGLGLSPLAQTHIRSMRLLQDKINIYSMIPNNNLLSNREKDEAYCLFEPTKQIAVYFTGNGNLSIRLDISSIGGKKLKFQWLDILSSTWIQYPTMYRGSTATLIAPSSNPWVVVLRK